jgi:hypothetical protein
MIYCNRKNKNKSWIMHEILYRTKQLDALRLARMFHEIIWTNLDAKFQA